MFNKLKNKKHKEEVIKDTEVSEDKGTEELVEAEDSVEVEEKIDDTKELAEETEDTEPQDELSVEVEEKLDDTDELDDEELNEIEESEVQGNEEDSEDDYSFTAFMLTFIYYFAKKDYVTGLAFLVTTVALPSNMYFVVGLIAGFFVGKGKIRSKDLTSGGIFVCCLSVIAFCLLKSIRYNLVGSI